MKFKFDLSGVIFVNPFIDSWTRVDTRARAFSVPPQQVKCFFPIQSFTRLLSELSTTYPN